MEFTTLYDPKQMPGQRGRSSSGLTSKACAWTKPCIRWRLLCFGMYGEVLPNQDGAPLRMVIAVEVWIQEREGDRPHPLHRQAALNTWQQSAPSEYGFYSNVNPNVDHPRWSQAKERRLGEFLKRPTLMFNGYDQVASLYTGMDLKKNF